MYGISGRKKFWVQFWCVTQPIPHENVSTLALRETSQKLEVRKRSKNPDPSNLRTDFYLAGETSNVFYFLNPIWGRKSPILTSIFFRWVESNHEPVIDVLKAFFLEKVQWNERVGIN